MHLQNSEQIREAFLEFFEEHRHQRVTSSSLIPYNDDTLLLTNAGMVQFKDVFLGLESRPYQRAVTSQKCMRVSGKHNDLENVGPSSRHHTFFEMLGNFSFGDYFKHDAIRYAYDFLTGVIGIPPERLYYTVFENDDEAFTYWTQDIGIEPGRVYRMGEKTNFWSMGDVGPCGPTSEVHYDWGKDACTCANPDCSVFLDNGCERWLEVWNLVFMQFNQDAEGVRTPLPRTGIDTGMGLERIVSIVQDKLVNYETDLFAPIMDRIQGLLGHSWHRRLESETGYRVIADHSRAAAFLVADGVRPGPAGPGYVLRMVIRRAHRFGRKIGFEGPFIAQVCDAVIDKMSPIYPELRERRSLIQNTVTLEEQQFIETLDRALVELDRALARIDEDGIRQLPGSVAFDLKSTRGLPLEVIRDICFERGYTVDEAGFIAAEGEHRRISQGRLGDGTTGADVENYARILSLLQDRGLIPEDGIQYDPYGPLVRSTQLLGIIRENTLVASASEGDEVAMILAETPFYVEAGGQVSDTGEIVGSDWRARITDTRRPVTGLPLLFATVIEGTATVGAMVSAEVDAGRRWSIMRNHTATHVLHRALRNRLGEHVHQAGSLVAPDRLRFDFTHDQALTQEDINSITTSVAGAILSGYDVHTAFKPLNQALREGATALFGEKYGEIVRTVTLGDKDKFWSFELCGGTHVRNSSQIGSFFITSEGSAAAGVRRIEAVTGIAAERYAHDRITTLDRVADSLNVPADAVETKVNDLKAQLSHLNRELNQLRRQVLSQQASTLVSQVREVGGVQVLATRVKVADVDGMRSLSDDLRNQIGSGVVILGSIIDEKPLLVAAATPDVLAKGVHAGQLVRALAVLIGGGGGGRPDMAQAGGNDSSQLDAALAAAPGAVQDQLR